MNMSKLMQQAEKIKAEMEKKQGELAHKIYEATAGGGMVTVKVNGKGELVAIQIDPGIISASDRGMLEDLIVAGVNAALRRMGEDQQNSMFEMMGAAGLKWPFS